MAPRIVTIGVYGFDEEHFLRALQTAQVDTFCDLRARRGVRGHDYLFANSTRLQMLLAEHNIRYLHLEEYAPSAEIRNEQGVDDKKAHIARRKRTELGETFRTAYKQQYLQNKQPSDFVQEVGTEAQVIALFCVEGQPTACHRSLVAEWLHENLGWQVEHITP
jgi:uncharacterized protein (DUF488 family)